MCRYVWKETKTGEGGNPLIVCAGRFEHKSRRCRFIELATLTFARMNSELRLSTATSTDKDKHARLMRNNVAHLHIHSLGFAGGQQKILNQRKEIHTRKIFTWSIYAICLKN
jgi:hypothetical protein